MIGSRIHWTVFRSLLVIGAIVAIIAQGCATHQSQDVGSLEDYEAQSQNNAYAYGYGPYDPYFSGYGYDPFWTPLYVAPIYYPRGDGDNDCDDGNCGGRVGGEHGGHRFPSPVTRIGSTLPATAPHSMPLAGVSHGFGGSGFAGGGFGGGHGGFGHR